MTGAERLRRKKGVRARQRLETGRNANAVGRTGILRRDRKYPRQSVGLQRGLGVTEAAFVSRSSQPAGTNAGNQAGGVPALHEKARAARDRTKHY